mmetsp:Transcript_76287/g.178954  ORF Transcript_76287/g.178954 Transcript_76287/m.178954 type:complete len:410 (-) Transcript_76287:32-1261(-)
MKDAVQKAFDTIDASPNARGCKTALILLTDGVPDNLQDPTTVIQTRLQSDASIVFFGYGIGSDQMSILENVACNTKGLFTQLQDAQLDNLRSAMSTYYDFFALQFKTIDTSVRWSEWYLPIPNVWGPMVAATTPIYKPGTSNPAQLIGVAGIDVASCDLWQLTGEPDEKAAETVQAILSDRSVVCPTIEFTDCAIEVLRARSGSTACPSATCTDAALRAQIEAKVSPPNPFEGTSNTEWWVPGEPPRFNTANANNMDNTPCSGGGCSSSSLPACTHAWCQRMNGDEILETTSGVCKISLTPKTDDDDDDDDDGPNIGVIVGATVAGVVVIGAVAGAFWYVKVRKPSAPELPAVAVNAPPSRVPSPGGVELPPFPVAQPGEYPPSAEPGGGPQQLSFPSRPPPGNPYQYP